VECQRQFSDVGWSVADTVSWTSKSVAKCHAVKCEDTKFTLLVEAQNQ